MRGHEIPRAISDSTPITVRAILPVGCEHTSALSASHPARRRLYSTEAECSLRDSVADRRLCPLPGSWATLAYMPRSSTPADPRPQALTGPAMWSSAKLTTSTPHGTLSRLNHAACTLSVYASQPGSPPDHATLDSGWWPALTGQGFHLLGRVEGFRHVYPSTWLSPSPSFAWRNNSLFLNGGPCRDRTCDHLIKSFTNTSFDTPAPAFATVLALGFFLLYINSLRIFMVSPSPASPCWRIAPICFPVASQLLPSLIACLRSPSDADPNGTTPHAASDQAHQARHRPLQERRP